MKIAFYVILFLWLICGLAAAWREDELDARHWKTIALGPVSLVDSFNEHPVSMPGPS
jgi:hypothetical protein